MASLGLPGRVAFAVDVLDGMADREMLRVWPNLIAMVR